MPSAVISKEIYQNMSNKELIEKQQDIEIKISKAQVSKFPADILNDMIKIREYIDEEINLRLDDGRMDEDELDEDF